MDNVSPPGEARRACVLTVARAKKSRCSGTVKPHPAWVSVQAASSGGLCAQKASTSAARSVRVAPVVDAGGEVRREGADDEAPGAEGGGAAGSS